MNGHSQQNGYFTNTIKEHIDNFNVYALDQMNFGKSEGPFRGLISSLEDSVQQAEQFVEFILSKLQNKPKIFLCGEASEAASVFIWQLVFLRNIPV
jgi:hypothetical protein